MQFFPVALGQRQLNAVGQDDSILAVEPGLHFLDPVDVDDRRTMNANELGWIESRLQIAQRLSQQMRLARDMDSHIVALGFDPVNLGGLDKKDAAIPLDHEPLQIALRGFELRQQVSNAVRLLSVWAVSDLRLCPIDRSFEAFLVKRLQQIVHCMHVKSAQSVAVKRRHKYDHRKPAGAGFALQVLEDPES